MLKSPCRNCTNQPEAGYLQDHKCPKQKECSMLQRFKEQAIDQQGTQGGVVDLDITYPVIY